MRKNIMLAAGVFMVFLCAQSVRAEMFSFSKSMGGTIADVRPDAISLTPSNPQSGNAPVDLEINNSTKLKDMQGVTDLKKGEAVQVKYKEQNGKKIAVQVEKDANAQAQDNAAAASSGAAVGASAEPQNISAIESPNTQGSKNTADDQSLKTNQGTNMGASNKESQGTDQSGAESSSQFAPGTSQQDQMNQNGAASTTTTTTTYQAGQAVDQNGQPAAQGQIHSSDPSSAEGTPAEQR